METSYLTIKGKRKLRNNILRLTIGHTIHKDLTYYDFTRDVAILYCDITGIAYQCATLSKCTRNGCIIVEFSDVKGIPNDKLALPLRTSTLILKRYAEKISEG